MFPFRLTSRCMIWPSGCTLGFLRNSQKSMVWLYSGTCNVPEMTLTQSTKFIWWRMYVNVKLRGVHHRKRMGSSLLTCRFDIGLLTSRIRSTLDSDGVLCGTVLAFRYFVLDCVIMFLTIGIVLYDRRPDTGWRIVIRSRQHRRHVRNWKDAIGVLLNCLRKWCPLRNFTLNHSIYTLVMEQGNEAISVLVMGSFWIDYKTTKVKLNDLHKHRLL